ncbi:MauE/DoxX family redox-associated membrane protein [Bacillus horti]|uniref:Methylamine utilisation protein MauE domain-containing protein n=1 Tax=Caldalkalibacillus horti TaxID=77523 RepID=A0ABT9W307_9BACI|nr:MauE/DoxX family redox-associated membrane protein [Bacillus horti]MDQ0167634.1 hypothetical protein [Bacillus horti]
MDWILFSRIFLSILFFFSALLKIVDKQNFINTIKDIGIRKELLSLAFGTLIIFEIIASILLWINSLVVFGLSLVYLLSIIFLFQTVKIIRSEEEVQCNCFGSLTDEKLGYSTLIRIFIILSVNTYLIININSMNSTFSLSEIFSYTTTSLGLIMLYSLLHTYTSLRVKINKEIK